MLHAQYNKSVSSLSAAHATSSRAEQEKIEEMDTLFHDGVRLNDMEKMRPLIEWANKVAPGSFNLSSPASATRKSGVGVRRVPIVDGHRREDYAGENWYHGSRNAGRVLLEGMCASAPPDMIDADPLGNKVPAREFDKYVQPPPMSAVRRWQNRGYDLGYSWLGYWRERLWEWYVGLSSEGRKALAQALEWREIPSATRKMGSVEADATADFLGDSLGLIWISNNIRTASDYAKDSSYGGKGALFKVDLTKANIFGSWSDDLAGGGEEVLVVPPSPKWCPQIPVSALKLISSPKR